MQKTRARAALVLFSIWLAAAAASRVDASSLYKCAGVDGSVSYQSQPCEPGADQVWERALTAEGRSATAPPGGSVASAADRPLARSAGAAPKASPPRKSASAACQRAHAADAAYRAQPLSRVKHDGLRRHGDRVRAACGSG